MTTITNKNMEGARPSGGLPTTPRTARLIAWCAFTLGVAASIAANVAHARPELGPRLASAFAPVALLLTVEIMSRVPWPAGSWWKLGRWVGTGTVALVAAVTSYRHMSALLASYGEDQLTAIIQPASVDGLMVVASLALLALGHTNERAERYLTTYLAKATKGASEHEGDSASTNTSWTSSTQRDDTPVPATPDLPTGLVMSANLLAAQHRTATGEAITVAALADRLGIDQATARHLLGVKPATGSPARINGHNPIVSAVRS